jgi:hypothetical protein
MDPMMTLRTSAAVMTVIAAALVAANWNARLTVAGFLIFIIASLAWMIDGWLESKASLVIQNGVLLLINVLGVWRWLPKAAKDMRLVFISPKSRTRNKAVSRDIGSPCRANSRSTRHPRASMILP